MNDSLPENKSKKQLAITKHYSTMKVIELFDLVSPCKPAEETKGEPSQPSRPNATRRRETYNPSISSLDVTVSGDSELDSSMEIVQENCK